MVEQIAENPLTADIDLELLATPFQMQTNWHVLTGAACSGKTTLIDMLSDLGYHTVPEVPRFYIEGELAKGRTLESIFGNVADERAMADMQQRIECGLEPAQITFLDRAIPDFLWFWRLLGLNPNELQ